MGLFVPNNPSWGYVTGNVLTTRPAAAFGTAITPGANNSYGSYVEVLAAASLTRDCYGLLLNFNSGNVTQNARDTIVTVGIDQAGGTSYVDTISHLIACCAADFDFGMGGHWYYFPLYVKSGSSIAAKASVNNGTAGSLRCALWLYGAPKNTSGLIYGHGVETIGADTATSAGTTVTAGTTSEGDWTFLGTTVKKWKFAQFCLGIHDSSMQGNNNYLCDLSHTFSASPNVVIIDQDKRVGTQGTAEILGSQLRSHSYCDAVAGAGIYGRAQCAGTPDSNLSMAAYGVY